MAEQNGEVNIQMDPSLQVMNSKINSSEGINKLQKPLIIIESIAFISISGFLIASSTNNRLRKRQICEFEIWRFCCLLLAIVCGRLFAFLITQFIVFMIWSSNRVNEKVLYFAYGVKKSVIVFIWLSLITLIWGLFFDIASEESKNTVQKITKGLVGGLIGTTIWLVKDLFIMVVGSNHATKLFAKINDAITNRNAISDISGMTKSSHCRTTTLVELVNTIRGNKLGCFSYVDQSDNRKEKNITNEKEAREAADAIFKSLGAKQIALQEVNHQPAATDGTNVEKNKNLRWYLTLEELLKFVNNENLEKQFTESAEVKQNIGTNREDAEEKYIKRSSFRQWMVDVYNEYESLNNTLMHSKTAIDDFNKITSLITFIVIIIVWLLFMEFLTTKSLVVLSGQLVLLAFIFGNTVKTVFEAIVFVFLIHPFDIGDRCVVDGVQMNVDEMKILSTAFLRYDGERIYYPNAVLASKPISNLYRSPPMGDSLEFAIDLSTPIDVLEELQRRIKAYLKSNPRRWKEDHMVQFKEIEDVNKMKMALYVGHTINFHYVVKRGKRRSHLVLEMKKIFEDLQIKYHLLPREVHVKYI